MSKRVLIVGGVAAGASTAARLRRLDETAEIVVFERGQDISFANCGLPYYVGGVIPQRNSLLVQTPASMKRRFNIDVRPLSEVKKIMREDKKIEVLDISKGESYTEDYDYLVLCPGAQPFVPAIQGIDRPNVFKLRNIPDSDVIKSYVQMHSSRRAVIVGGGYVGMEMAEVLLLGGVEVTLIEATRQVMGALDEDMAAIVHSYLRDKGVNLILGDPLVELSGDKEASMAVTVSGTEVPTDLVIIGTGVKPEAGLARDAGLEVGRTGGILVDEYLRTSDPSIYAAGDAVQVKDKLTGEDVLVPLASPANRQGWVVANNIAGKSVRYEGVQGTSILKFVDLAVAVTGRNEKALAGLGRAYQTCHIHPFSHATYYSGSTQMTMKLIFDPGDGKVLGAQIVGYDGVDKRIDVLSTAIRAGMTVYDLQTLELAYAPPFSSAKDPVNMIGYAAGNILDNNVKVVKWQDVPEMIKGGAFLLDARTPPEYGMGHAEHAANIPVDDLRARIGELPRDREILAYCEVGLRSYIAGRILAQNGFDVRNISGGYRMKRFLDKGC
jgi:NADPH-dependent 2,4-dienoyl-CoA reductase/sulfur reductase-like enzyme/rhodanese-related sulfurtransferase